MDILKMLLEAIKAIFGPKADPVPQPVPDPTPIPKPQPDRGKVPPKMNTVDYRAKLKAEVAKEGVPPTGYTPIADDPNTKENERKTWCNYFIRAVYQWFAPGDKTFETEQTDQAGEITRYMRTHPETWRPVDCDEAVTLAKMGYLVVAAQEEPNPPPTGHVCIVAPEDGCYSGKWKKNVPSVANVGGHNWYGQGLNMAFGKQEPELFHFLGV